MILHRYTFLGSLIIASVLVTSAARADVISVIPSVSGSPGTFAYSYEIDNQTSVGLLLFSLTVTGDVGTIQAPSGWVTATGTGGPGETLVEWISTDVPFDVAAFGSLSGFSFTSDSDPGTVAFSTFDENFGEFDGLATGPVFTPAPVPEPGQLGLLLASVCILLFFKTCALFVANLRRRRAKARQTSA